MRSLSSSELLEIWERGQVQTQVQRGIALLASAYPELNTDELAKLPIGKRDSLLLGMRASTFGPRLECLATCPRCSERLELALDVQDVMAAEAEQTEMLSINEAGFEVRFRQPNSLDLVAIGDLRDLAAIRQLLIERCLVEAVRMSGEISLDKLPAEVTDAMVKRMAEADPQADVQLALSCPACGHEWLSAFDILSFFWDEINVLSRRLLHDVHVLARAYCWSEAEILNMSPWRRQAYLDLVASQ
jgi:hypothetical protein